MLDKIFGKKESATRIHRTNGMASIVPPSMVDSKRICRTVESAISSIERTGVAFVPNNDKALIGSLIEKLWGDVEWPTQ